MTIETAHLLLLLNWMSPAFPIGGFAYSHGLEWAIAEGAVKTPQSVESWIADLISTGSGWTDAVLFARCYADDRHELNALALALAGSLERHRETTELGRNFRIAAVTWTGQPATDAEIAYPIAAGTVCAATGIPKEAALAAFLQGFCAALVSVAVRLVPIGQTAGLAILRDLSPMIGRNAQRAATATLDDLGSNTLMSDIAAMKHETLEPRIFRT